MMDFKQKAIFFLGGGILIVIIVFFFTSNNDKPQEVTEINNEETYQYGKSDDVTNDNENDENGSSNEDEDMEKEDIHVNIEMDLEHEEHGSDTDEYDYDYVKDVLEGNIEQEIDEDEIPDTSDDLYDEKELSEAKKVAEKFIKAYYDYDGDDTSAGIKRAKKYMTDDLYKELLEEDKEQNPVHSSFYKEFKKLKYSETFVVPEVLQELSETGIFIRYSVYGEHKDPFKKEKKDVKDVYVLALDKHGKKYKVEYLLINQPLF